MWWPEAREDGFRRATVAAVVVWVVGLLFLAGIVLSVIYGLAFLAIFLIALAVIGVIGSIVRGNDR